MKTLILSLALLSSAANASNWLVSSVASHHYSNEKFNERNYGLGLEHDIGNDFTIAGGFYNNSFNRNSNYVAGSFTPIRVGKIHFGTVLGVVTGYDANRFQIFGAGICKVEFEKVGANILITPRTSFNPTTVALQLKYKF